MIRKITITLILILSFSCFYEPHPYHETHYDTHKFKRVQSRFSNYVKPSESMKFGAKKSNYRQPNYFSYQKQNSLNYYEEPYSTPMLEAMQNKQNQPYYPNRNYEGYFKIGNPYKIYGITYTPQNYQHYDEVGISSWYGEDFHGKMTANGEIYNLNDMTAAHPTLPMPSLVRVTNLENGKSVIVRVNDRGPFAKNRIIDVSKKAANLLGFQNRGTAKVRVQLLRQETDELLHKLHLRD